MASGRRSTDRSSPRERPGRTREQDEPADHHLSYGRDPAPADKARERHAAGPTARRERPTASHPPYYSRPDASADASAGVIARWAGSPDLEVSQ